MELFTREEIHPDHGSYTNEVMTPVNGYLIPNIQFSIFNFQ